MRRFAAIWFPHLVADRVLLRRPEWRGKAFALTTLVRGKKIVTVVDTIAAASGIMPGMTAADAKALVQQLELADDIPGSEQRLLEALARWCIRFTPIVSVDLPGGLLLDISGCAHLWNGEENYLRTICRQLNSKGYTARMAIADTIGAAWAMARFGDGISIVPPGSQLSALLPLPPGALRLETVLLERLHKLGLYSLRDFISMPRPALRRRFGESLLNRIDQALGTAQEWIEPVLPVPLYEERLPCLEPIVTATGIEIALQRLLDALCTRLQQEGKGLRCAVFNSYRVDGKIERIQIGTNHASTNREHLFRLFQLKIATIEPALGIELFTLQADKLEPAVPEQESFWIGKHGLQDKAVIELLDRIAGKLGADRIRRFLPAEHYWPERSIKAAVSLQERPATHWQEYRPRPIRLLTRPEPIEVTAPIPDYPPMLFRYQGKLHTIKKADGPERIEREWWLENGRHRDYYYVEDETGARFWLYRLGHYGTDQPQQWFLHGFFA
ncbi:MAG: DNA polymerase Y family protein [Chitinophagaceae bacterium]|nr:DNA polymerase Y family protein [Chitinophagaceae bacterium]